MELTSKRKDVDINERNRSSPGKERPREKVSGKSELIRNVRRGIMVVKKYLQVRDNLDDVDINEIDLNGNNIFHLSIHNTELVEFLLKTFKNHPQIKQTLYMEDANGLTPAHLAALLNQNKSMQVFLACDNNMFDVRSQLSGKTLIHCAVESGNEYIVQNITKGRPNSIFDQDNYSRTPLLYAAALKEDSILKYFLCQGLDTLERDVQGYTALHVAAESGSISNVILLLTYDIELINTVDNIDQTALHLACQNGHGNIVTVLLNNGADPILREQNGDTALDCAIKNKRRKATENLLMSDYWKELINEYEGGCKKCFVTLLKQMPRSAEILLDHCVNGRDDDPNSESYSVTYDFFLLEFSGNSTGTNEGLPAIVENEREECLMHDVTRKFLSVKWQGKGHKLYMANLVLYLIFHILLNIYVILIRGSVTAEALEGSNVATRAPGTMEYPTPRSRPDETGPIISTSIIVVFTLVNIIKEFCEMCLRGWKYFRHGSNYIEWLLYISVLLFMFPISSRKSTGQYVAACIAVFLTWLNLIWFLRRIPSVGTYILALQRVFITLVKMLSITILFNLAFASIFHMLLAEYARYRSFHVAVISTLVSMLGDFDYDDLFVQVGYHESLYSIKQAVFVIFVLLMSIVINNVLIGLAVGDTDSVMNQANLKCLWQQVKYIIEIETSMLSRLPCFKLQENTIYVEYPNQRNTTTDKTMYFMFGEREARSKDEEDQENRGTNEEKMEGIVKLQLEKYHKQMMEEMKEFRKDLMEEIKLNANQPSTG